MYVYVCTCVCVYKAKIQITKQLGPSQDPGTPQNIKKVATNEAKKWTKNETKTKWRKHKKSIEIMNAKDINTKQLTRWDFHYCYIYHTFPWVPWPRPVISTRMEGNQLSLGGLGSQQMNQRWNGWTDFTTVSAQESRRFLVFWPSATIIHLHLPSSQNFVGSWSTFGAMSYDQGFSQAGSSGSCAKWIQVACCCSRSPRPW